MMGKRAGGACLLALLAVGCGQPEKAKAPKTAVQDAVTGIVTACGEAHMVIAGRGPESALRRLDAQALPHARRLVALERRDPGAIYLSSSMASLLETERTAAQQCRLVRTARRLR
jgi:hypothetical protein